MIMLSAGTAKAEIFPQMGGGLATLWAADLPVLRPWSGKEEDGPFAMACNLLVPFCNRISSGGFTYAGHRYNIGPNLPGEVYPIHGDGFQKAWQVEDAGPSQAELHLPDGAIGPFQYEASVSYSLSEASLETRLAVTNRGTITLPFDLGLHPWFPRDPATRLQFFATGQWPETADHLPATPDPVPLDHGGPWHNFAALPDGWINAGFSGWDGHAKICQGRHATSVSLSATGVGTAILYSPSAKAGFFCFEPVSHPVDAHNLQGQPGLVPLAPGETLTLSMTLTWGNCQ